MKNFKFVVIEDATRAYCDIKISKNASQGLKRSCMNGERDIISFYKRNNVPVLCLLDEDGSLVGRAMLWNASVLHSINIKELPLEKEVVFMDRIYGDEDVIERFKNYADEHGFVYKASQHYVNDGVFVYNGKLIEVCLTTDIVKCEMYPYMDTLKYLDDEYDTLTTKPCGTGRDKVLDSNDGGYSEY